MFLTFTGLPQEQLRHELAVSENTSVDWYMFHREACEEVIMRQSQPLGGTGIRVQIDESKFGKRKYHRGHRVEGQWVFGGIEEDSRKNFLVPVERRNAETLIPIIKRYAKIFAFFPFTTCDHFDNLVMINFNLDSEVSFGCNPHIVT